MCRNADLALKELLLAARIIQNRKKGVIYTLDGREEAELDEANSEAHSHHGRYHIRSTCYSCQLATCTKTEGQSQVHWVVGAKVVELVPKEGQKVCIFHTCFKCYYCTQKYCTLTNVLPTEGISLQNASTAVFASS